MSWGPGARPCRPGEWPLQVPQSPNWQARWAAETPPARKVSWPAPPLTPWAGSGSPGQPGSPGVCCFSQQAGTQSA
eukprot:8539887-Lingulodinium_polyedra.AAC.1